MDKNVKTNNNNKFMYIFMESKYETGDVPEYKPQQVSDTVESLRNLLPSLILYVRHLLKLITWFADDLPLFV